MICIYKITNTVTGDFYIGQTIDFHERELQHKRDPQPKMRDDVEKYGWDAFKFEVVEECSREELNDKENYYITKLDPAYNTIKIHNWTHTPETCKKISKSLMGHKVTPATRIKLSKIHSGKVMSTKTREKISNTLVGTTNGNTSFLEKKHTLKARMQLSKPIVCIETEEIFWSIQTAAEHLKISASNIVAVLSGRQITAGGFHWQYVDDDLNKKVRDTDRRKKTIICTETNHIFESVEQAALAMALNPCGISHVLHGRAKTCGSFHFEYLESSSKNANEEKGSIRKKLLGTKPVPIVCVETGKIYSTIKAASKEIKVASQSISAVLNGRRMTAGGFHWKYLEEILNVTPKKPSKGNSKSVICVETGEIFPNIKTAADSINISTQAISGVLRGKGILAGGFHWKYIEDEINKN